MLEIDLSLCVFREIWASAGSWIESKSGDEDSENLILMKELGGEMQIWAEGAQSVWLAVGFEKTAKKAIKCTGTRQADSLLIAFYPICEIQ